MTRPRAAALALLTLPLAGCGTNLTVLHQRWPVRGPGDEVAELHVENQPPLGIAAYGPPVAVALGGLLLEPVDWLFSSVAFVAAPFSGETSVAGGPFGYLAALTPFATLVPAMTDGPRGLQADAAMLARLRSPAAEERRKAAQALVGPIVHVRAARLVAPR